jgi:hypothetical protein
MLIETPVLFTLGNAQRLKNGHGIIQLKHAQMTETHPHRIHLSQANNDRFKKAHMSKKGVRLSLSPQEIDATINGAGFMDFLRFAGKALIKGAKAVVNSNLYQTEIKPEIRKVVDSGLSVAKDILPQPLANIATSLVNQAGKSTNAFGLPKPKPKKRAKIQAQPLVGGSFTIN